MAVIAFFRTAPRAAVLAPPLAALWAAIVMAAGPPPEMPAAVTPDLVSQPVAIAAQTARLAGLELVHGVFYVAPRHWREEVRPRCIHLQSPRAGTPVPEGSQVAGWSLVEAGPDRKITNMPDLDGLALDAAVAKLEPLGLVVMPAVAAAERARPAGADARVVVDAYPRPGQAVYAGTHVLLVFESR